MQIKNFCKGFLAHDIWSMSVKPNISGVNLILASSQNKMATSQNEIISLFLITIRL